MSHEPPSVPPRGAFPCLPLLAALPLLVAVACAPGDPPTVTPPPPGAGTDGGLVPGGSSVIEMTMPAPPQREAAPVTIGQGRLHLDADGHFRMEVPIDWVESRQEPSPGTDIRVGTVFQAPDGDGLLSVTQFDNGRPPAGLGSTVNTVLRDVTGWMDQPGYRELDRESVVERPGEAMRVEIVYERSGGVPMHALALFQIDGTVFSMVNLSLEEGSWAAHESRVREILRSYEVLGVAVPTPSGTAEGVPDGTAPADGETPASSTTGPTSPGGGEGGAAP